MPEILPNVRAESAGSVRLQIEVHYAADHCHRGGRDEFIHECVSVAAVTDVQDHEALADAIAESFARNPSAAAIGHVSTSPLSRCDATLRENSIAVSIFRDSERLR